MVIEHPIKNRMEKSAGGQPGRRYVAAYNHQKRNSNTFNSSVTVEV